MPEEIVKQPRLVKRQKLRAEWIADTQMFQRIAGVPESSDQELGADWDAMKSGKGSNRLK